MGDENIINYSGADFIKIAQSNILQVYAEPVLFMISLCFWFLIEFA